MAQTKFSDPADLEADFIVYLCKKVHGIGDKTAKAVAVQFEDAEVFARCTEAELLNWKSQTGKQVLKPQQAKDIVALRDEFMPRTSRDIRQLWISALIRDFVENALHEINQTDFEKLLINPFLIRAFNFTDHREVIRFCFYQKVTRSIVTSWGFIVEDMLIVTGSVKTRSKGFDLRVERDGKIYDLQIKSSPNTMNVEAVDTLNANIKKLEEAQTSIGMLGVTYGVKTQLSAMMQKVEGEVLIGRDLWDFVADEKGYTEKVLQWAAKGMPGNTDFGAILEAKEKLIAKEWEAKYGTGIASIEKALERYV